MTTKVKISGEITMHESVNERGGEILVHDQHSSWRENDDEVASITRFHRLLRKFQFIRVFGRFGRPFKNHANDTTNARTKSRYLSCLEKCNVTCTLEYQIQTRFRRVC